jgi:hypothetical protein
MPQHNSEAGTITFGGAGIDCLCATFPKQGRTSSASRDHTDLLLGMKSNNFDHKSRLV